MAIKDPNVLNRINTLNSDLENANTTEIERNISNNLFNVLEGANSISVDSELYASINNVTDASDLDAFINRNKNDLPHNPADRLQINYAGGPYDVANTIVNLPTTAGIAETQNAINNMNNAINGLNNLPSQINTLRSRLGENLNILNETYDTQSGFEAGGYAARRRPNEIQNDINICNELKNYLRIIDDDERYLSAHPGDVYHTNRRNQAITDFNNNRIAGIDEYNDYGADFGRISTQLKNIQRGFTTEHGLITELLRNEKRFKKTQCTVPGNFGLFNSNNTVITTPLISAVGIDTDRDHIRDWLAQLDVLETQIETLRIRYQENLNRLDRILALQQLQQRMNTTHPGEMNRRRDEFRAIRDISQNHLLLGNAAYIPYLPNQTINVGGNLGPVNLNFIHNLPLVNRTANYSLCDRNGNPLRNNGGRLELQLEGGQTINVRGIAFDNTTQRMTINNLEITPIEGLTFPLNLDLNVRVRIHDNATGLDIDHHKPIHFEINRPSLTQILRENAYDSLVPPMNERIEAEYSNNYRENLENEAIWRILREGGNETEVNEIYDDETRRNLLQDRMRRLLNRYFPANALTLNDLQASFRGHMTTRNEVPAQYLLNSTTFTDYVRNSIPDRLREHASGRIYNQINTAIRTNILKELLNFQADVANGCVDNLDNLRLLAQIPSDANGPQGHPDSGWQRLRGRRSIKNNYTKFFQGRNASLDNQSLETEDGEIKYGVNVEVAGVNRIIATINIDGKEEPEIIEAANHDRLIRGILNRANTKDGEPLNRKLRCNIALSVLKAMVMMSPQRLNREIPPRDFRDNRGNTVRCNRIEAFIRGNNLTIRGGTVDPATRVRQNATIFDENLFKSLHDINSLEDCVRELSVQINSIMNSTAQEYQNATNGRMRNRENRNLLKYDTKQWLRGGPIKRLRGRLRHGKTNNDFNFDTSINEAGKSVNISFNNGRFTVSGEFDGQEYSYEAKDLGSILRKKINRKRVFDGIELAMVAIINEEYVNKLRTNNLVQTENFAVSDLNNDKTGKIYIFDEDGNLSYLEIEDRALNPLRGRNAGRIDTNAIPIERIRCNDQERREFFQNPLLAGRLLREMKRGLALF